jgi:cysteine desulfurase
MCDLMGVVIGKGSACKSYEPTPSETLLAIGLTEEQALSTIRISLDEFNTVEEISRAADIITQLVEQLRKNA